MPICLVDNVVDASGITPTRFVCHQPPAPRAGGVPPSRSGVPRSCTRRDPNGLSGTVPTTSFNRRWRLSLTRARLGSKASADVLTLPWQGGVQ